MKKVFLAVMILSGLVLVINNLQGDGTTIAKEVMRIHHIVKEKPVGRAPAIIHTWE